MIVSRVRVDILVNTQLMDTFAHNHVELDHAVISRPGRQTTSLLAVLREHSTAEVGKALREHFSSVPGNVEEALEQAVKRANAAFPGEATGSILALACEEGQFAVATGGEASAYASARGTAVDVSPAPTATKRDKYFAALAAGACGMAPFIIALRKLKSDELTRYCSVQAGTAVAAQLISEGVACVTPAAQKNSYVLFRMKTALFNARKAAPRLLQRETWVRAGKEIISFARNPKQWVLFFSTVPARLYRLMQRLQRLAPKKKLGVLAGVIAAAVIFHVVFSALGAHSVEEIIAETLDRENRIAELIRQKKDTEALAELDEAIALLAHAPVRLNEAQQGALASLQTRLLRTASDLNHVTIIPAPTPVVSLERSFREGRQFDLSGLALADGRLYTVNRAAKEIYELDGKERRIVIVKDFPAGAGAPTGIVSSVPGLVMITTEHPYGVLALSPKTRALSFAPLALPRAESLPVSFAAYNQKLYVLDARVRAIYRYELTPQGFNLWSAWTSESTLDFSQATTFAIDGSIYVTFSDHDIVKLTQGKREPFAVESIRPPLERVTAIATKENSPLLYLLDAPQRRVVIIKKDDGTLVAQYTSPVFTDLRGLFPDETAKRIYVLNGDTIYSMGPDDENILDQLNR